jgi:glycolate oxidase FAD binding subunit
MDAALERIAARVRAARASGAPLRLRGGGTKDFYGGALRGEILDTREHSGIASYEPSELVVTARCGTPLSELESALGEKAQMLPFEPPHFGPGATLGGCVAAGLSGPRRVSAGPLRDYVLGARLLDGDARLLAFGGQVMKNVAGYDVSRLLAGSLGTLGVIAEVSLKVLPKPQSELNVRLELPEDRAIEALNRWAGQPLAISATAWCGGELRLRLSGAEPAIRSAAAQLGGERLAPGAAEAYWRAVREHTDPFFAGEEPLWRIALPSAAAPLGLPGRQLIEWSGGLRWLMCAAEPELVRETVRRAGGHATLFRGADKSAGAFAPLDPVMMRLHRRLKSVFDPAGILNPGRLYPDL